jgi:hypothetical protein
MHNSIGAAARCENGAQNQDAAMATVRQMVNLWQSPGFVSWKTLDFEILRAQCESIVAAITEAQDDIVILKVLLVARTVPMIDRNETKLACK